MVEIINEPTLPPCKLCGGEGYLRTAIPFEEDWAGFKPCCKGCSIELPSRATKEEAAEHWCQLMGAVVPERVENGRNPDNLAESSRAVTSLKHGD